MFDELNTDGQEARRNKAEGQGADGENTASGKAFLAFMAILVPLYFLVNHFWGGDIALTVYMCLAISMVAIGMCWDLSKHLWFWVVIALLLALHVPLILIVKWPHYWIPGIALLPIGLVDLFITVKVVRFVQKYIVKSPAPDEEI